MSLARDTAIFGSQKPKRKNVLINGSFDVWQRGTSFTAVAGFIADRWSVTKAGAAVLDAAWGVTTAGQDLPFSIYANIEVATADASLAASDHASLVYFVEGWDTVPFMLGKTSAEYITISFHHAHTKTGTYSVALRNDDSDRSYVAEYTQSVADTWEESSITLKADTLGTWKYGGAIGIRLSFSFGHGSDFTTTPDVWGAGNLLASTNQVNALDTIGNKMRFGNVQMELGKEKTDFEHRAYADELILCERYYQRMYITSYTPIGVGRVTGGGVLQGAPIHLRTEMRTTPTVSCTSSAAWRTDTATQGGNNIGTSTAWFTNMGTRSIRFLYTTGTTPNIYAIYFATNVTVVIDAEL